MHIQEIETILDRYISKYRLTPESIDSFLKDVGYVPFFNDITINCLGNIAVGVKHQPKTNGALIYLPDDVKDKLILDFDIVNVSALYFGIITKGDLSFNYKEYPLFLKQLFLLRKTLKKAYMENNSPDTMVKIYLLKAYMNAVYGMINNPSSVLSSNNVNPREFIVDQSKKVMLSLISFFINKTQPVYYVDTDELFVPHVKVSQYIEMEEYFKKHCSQYIDITVSRVGVCETERNMDGYILFKKKMIIGKAQTSRNIGLNKVNNNRICIQNKKFFGRNYRDIFPEYAIW